MCFVDWEILSQRWVERIWGSARPPHLPTYMSVGIESLFAFPPRKFSTFCALNIESVGLTGHQACLSSTIMIRPLIILENIFPPNLHKLFRTLFQFETESDSKIDGKAPTRIEASSLEKLPVGSCWVFDIECLAELSVYYIVAHRVSS